MKILIQLEILTNKRLNILACITFYIDTLLCLIKHTWQKQELDFFKTLFYPLKVDNNWLNTDKKAPKMMDLGTR